MEALLAYYTDPGVVKTAALPRRSSVLGSSRDTLVPVRDASMRPHQAGLTWQASRATWELTRLDEDGIVEVNGRNVDAGEVVQLNHFDEIRTGNTLFRFHKQPAEPKCAGKACEELELDGRTVIIGRATPAAVVAEPNSVRLELDGDDSGISRIHAKISCDRTDWHIEDLSKTGMELNGRTFTRRPLVFGDRFRIRDYFFEFTGTSIIRVDQASGGRLTASAITVTVPWRDTIKTLLNRASLEIQSGEFVGILGLSGTGKTTLLKAVCGLIPVAEGSVTVDGVPLQDAVRTGAVGYVPQDDIVHRELTVQQALRFSARLRLRAPVPVLESLVDGTIQRLGLTAQMHQRISDLSGGQRKRVNIATELLARPPALLLDEPSSGLDPANEEELMSLLQNLRLTGQTVICSTHILHKAYLFDRICYVHGGQVLFIGTPAEARQFFFEEDDTASATAHRAPLEKIYSMFTRSADQTALWQQKFADSPMAPGNRPAAPPPLRLVPNRSLTEMRPGVVTRLVVLLARQWAILRSDRMNLVFLAAQAAVIGGLAGWVGRGQPEFRMFLAMIATLWFGCSNASQQFTREIPAFQRERVSGLGIHTYLQSKWIMQSVITLIQCVVMLACMAGVVALSFAITGRPNAEWAGVSPAGHLLHGLSFVLTVLTGVGIGLSVSALARSSIQAAIWVPLILIPQILFAGFVVPLADMPASVRLFSRAVPSASSQRLLDVGHVLGREMPVMTHNTVEPMFWTTVEATDHGAPYEPRKWVAKNLNPDESGNEINELNHLSRAWQNAVVDHSRIGSITLPSSDPKPPGRGNGSRDDSYTVYVSAREDIRSSGGVPMTAGTVFNDLSGAWMAASFLGGWLVAAYAAIYMGLCRRDPLRMRHQIRHG